MFIILFTRRRLVSQEVRALNGLTPNSTGWAAMAKTMREVDEAKVKDYKEDIDTLLVLVSPFMG